MYCINNVYSYINFVLIKDILNFKYTFECFLLFTYSNRNMYSARNLLIAVCSNTAACAIFKNVQIR